MNEKIVVIGSSNTDMVIKTERLPLPGESVLGGIFKMNPGGKGANQAVAAARLGASVTFIAKVGSDIFGSQATQLFEKECINTSFIKTDSETPSGIALIFVDSKGENCIAVASGSNSNLSTKDIVEARSEILESWLILLQLEIPLETVLFAADIAFSAGKKVILNPAPARSLPDDLLKKLFLITPNETEAEILTGIRVDSEASAEKAAICLWKKGVKNVIITLGSRGAYLYNETNSKLIPSPKVIAIDSTAAGDVFNGAIASCLSKGYTLENSIAIACQAASISVTRLGAQDSAPFANEIVF